MRKSIFFFIIIFTGLYGEISKEELLGKINPETHPDFIKVDGFYLRKEVALKFKEMIREAKKENINLYIVSGFRSFEKQKAIWENKAKRINNKDKLSKIKRLLRYSAMPGTSRHHWGTDIDIVSVNPSFFDGKEGKKIYQWLKNNAYKYGFFQPYTSSITNGYNEEKWHWSYKPLAEKFLIEYTNKITYDDLTDFFGAEVVQEFDIFNNYILNISQ